MRNAEILKRAGWRSIGDKRCYFRSRWEINFARVMQWEKEAGRIQDWEFEPKTFWFEGIKRGTVCYIPDFKISMSDGSHFWVEIKGRMDAKSKTKIKRFAKYFPEEHLVVLREPWFRRMFKIMGSKVKWEWK